jgi:chemotaxis response regulator CheB
VIGRADNRQDFMEKGKQLTPDVILMGISMPRINELEAAKLI